MNRECENMKFILYITWTSELHEVLKSDYGQLNFVRVISFENAQA